MVDRRDVGSWLEGPGRRRPDDGDAGSEYAGQRLGLPAHGPGAMAGFGRRLGAIFIDWTVCQVIAIGLFTAPLGEGAAGSWIVLAIFAVENLVLVTTTGSTLGHRLVGIGVRGFEGAVRPTQVLLRTLLLCLAIPALVWDRDGRGLHDRAAGTVIVRR